MTYTDDGRIEGWVVTEPAYVDIYQKGATVTMYFSAVLDAEPAAWGAFSGEQTFAGERSRTGAGAGLYLRFDTRERQQVGLKIGLSYTSVENARLNLEKEAARKGFDRVRREANDTWEEALGRLRVEGGLHDDRVKFYTGLFHALLGRGGQRRERGYPANDGTVGQCHRRSGQAVHDYYNTERSGAPTGTSRSCGASPIPNTMPTGWRASCWSTRTPDGSATASHAASTSRA